MIVAFPEKKKKQMKKLAISQVSLEKALWNVYEETLDYSWHQCHSTSDLIQNLRND